MIAIGLANDDMTVAERLYIQMANLKSASLI
jgi:hypothetical protein